MHLLLNRVYNYYQPNLLSKITKIEENKEISKCLKFEQKLDSLHIGWNIFEYFRFKRHKKIEKIRNILETNIN